METYKELKQRHAKELNDFTGVFWAFSDEQFIKGMKSIGLTPDDTKLIFSIGAGGYLRKDVIQAWHDMFKRQAKEKKDRSKEEKFLIESIVYQLGNHEYGYTHDYTDSLDALGLDENNLDPKVLRKAIDLYNAKDREAA